MEVINITKIMLAVMPNLLEVKLDINNFTILMVINSNNYLVKTSILMGNLFG